MKCDLKHIGLMLCGVLLSIASVADAQEPEMPMPTKEHELLSQFAGEWNVVALANPAPAMEPMKCEGTEHAKMVGGFWLVGQGHSNMMGMTVNSQLTLGYSPESKKYVGTFLCSMDHKLWQYEGTMDESGKKLTLETEGPLPFDRSQKTKYREILELKDQDHKTFTSYMLHDGEWIEIVKMEYTRKK